MDNGEDPSVATGAGIGAGDAARSFEAALVGPGEGEEAGPAAPGGVGGAAGREGADGRQCRQRQLGGGEGEYR